MQGHGSCGRIRRSAFSNSSAVAITTSSASTAWWSASAAITAHRCTWRLSQVVFEPNSSRSIDFIPRSEPDVGPHPDSTPSRSDLPCRPHLCRHQVGCFSSFWTPTVLCPWSHLVPPLQASMMFAALRQVKRVLSQRATAQRLTWPSTPSRRWTSSRRPPSRRCATAASATGATQQTQRAPAPAFAAGFVDVEVPDMATPWTRLASWFFCASNVHKLPAKLLCNSVSSCLKRWFLC